MRKFFQLLFIILIYGVEVQSQCETDNKSRLMEASNVCLFCAVEAQKVLGSEGGDVRIPLGSQTLLMIRQSTDGLLSSYEASALQKLRNRVRSYANSPTSFLEKLIYQAESSQNIRFKLFYQFELDSNSDASLYTARAKPIYDLTKELPHELWGHYLIHDYKAYVMLNEYQNVWNADYTLVHELFHLLDVVTQNYQIENKSNWGILDDFAIEYRAMLAEVHYRLEMLQTPQFKADCMAVKDFRDEFIRGTALAGRSIDHAKLMNYVLDLYYPVRLPIGITAQVPKIFEMVNIFFTQFFDKSANKKHMSAQGIYYEYISTWQVKEKNTELREMIRFEARQRGAEDLLDYLIKNKITSPITSSAIRSDRRYNIRPDKASGRWGGP